MPAGGQIDAVSGEIIVRQRRAFGLSSGSGSVNQRCRSIAIEIGKANGAGIRVEKSRQLIFGDEDFGIGVAQDVRHFTIAIEDIDRHENRTEFHASQEEIDHLDPIGEVDANAVALRDASGGERVGHAVGTCVDFAEGKFRALPFERDPVAAAGEGEIEKLAKVHIFSLECEL